MDLNEYNKNQDQFLDGLKNEAATSPDQEVADKIALKTHGVEEFFERPWFINSISYPIGSSVGTYVSPLGILATTPMSLRLAGLSRIRFQEMELTFTVSSSPFAAGLIAASWFPMQESITATDSYGHPSVFAWDNLTTANCTGFTPRTADLDVELTSRRHVLIPISNGTSVTLKVPFIWPEPWISTYYNSGTFSSFTDAVTEFGLLAIRPIVPVFDCASTPSTDAPTIALTAKLNGVEVMGLTAWTQSVSSTFAALGDLVKANRWFMGRAAKPVEDVMKAGESVAKYYGCSNGNNTQTVAVSSRNHTLGWSSTERSVPMDSTGVVENIPMLLDPKKHGAERDELVINTLTSRSVYDTEFGISPASVAGVHVARLNVCPQSYEGTLASAINTTISGTNTCSLIKPTPMTGIMQFFSFWRGSIKYKIHIVASAMHRGVIRVHWDNIVAGHNKASQGHVTCPSVVIDLDKTREAEIVIPYAASTHWLPCHTLEDFSVRQSSGSLLDSRSGVYNGQLVFTVVAPIRAPSSTGITVVVFKSSDDIEFAAPRDPRAEMPSLSIIPYCFCQSLTVEPEKSVKVMEEDTPIAMVTMGESIRSLRELLHRATFTTLLTSGQNRGSATKYQRVSKWMMRRRPAPHGWLAGSRNPQMELADSSLGAIPYNFNGNFFMDAILSSFVGWKGSIKYRIVPLVDKWRSCSMLGFSRSFTDWDVGVRGNIATTNPQEWDIGGNTYHTPMGYAASQAMPRLIEGGTVAVKDDPLMVEANDYVPQAFNFTNLFNFNKYEVTTDHQYSNNTGMFGAPDMVEITSVSAFDIPTASTTEITTTGLPLAVFTSAGTSLNVIEFVGFPCLFFNPTGYYDLNPASAT
jgi:hypothetical protein